MNISSAVRHLLHRYDCVVIPGLGGFVCNYEAARIHPVQHKFHPPNKRITFNQLLLVNDGLLAHFLSQQNGSSYEVAVEDISREVASWKRELSEGRAVHLDGIGFFSNNADGRLVFDARNSENFLIESYGLTVFHSLPVSRKEVLKVVKNETRPQIEPEVAKGFAWDRLANYSSAAAVISLVALTTFKLNIIGGDKLNRIGLDFLSGEKAVYQEMEYPELKFEDSEGQSSLRDLVGKENANFLDYLVLDKKLVVKLKDEVSIESAVKNQGPYHVVAGCFGVESNATRLNRKLRDKGFDSQLPGLYNGLHVVSYGSFNSKAEARQLLSRVKREENSSAWILKK